MIGELDYCSGASAHGAILLMLIAGARAMEISLGERRLKVFARPGTKEERWMENPAPHTALFGSWLLEKNRPM